MKSHIYFILVFLIVSSSLKSQISHKVSFTEKELTFEKVMGENKKEYMKVNYSGLSSQGIDGTPELPMKYIKVRVPVMANNISITIEKISKQNIPLSAGIYPAQPGVPMSDSASQPISFVDCDPAVYNSDNGFPKEIVSIVGNGYLLGNIHIIDLAISPIVYYPKENRLELNSEISLRIDYSVSEMASINEGMRIINRISGNDEEFDLNNLVVNPDFKEPAINKGSSISSRSISSTSLISLPFFEYIVITNNELKPSFNQLVSWERTKGYNAGVVTMEEILADDGITGDTTATYALNDSAGKLRQYLTYAWERGTKYVLLGGVGSIVPFRYGTGYNNNWYCDGDSLGAKIPTDHYYCDLTSNWKKDNDLYLGERIGDPIDFNVELYVGRILCENAEEVANYTYKLIKYERNPGNGDFSYIRKAFITESDQMQVTGDATYVKDKLRTFNSVIFRENITDEIHMPTFPTGDTVIAEMNKGYGFISCLGHGAPASIVVASKGPNYSPQRLIIPTNNDWQPPELPVRENFNSFANLTNYNTPSIFYTFACQTMPYDKRIINNLNYQYNMGQAFTIAGKYGGPAYLGNTRNGFLYQNASRELFGFFLDLLYNEYYTSIASIEEESRARLNCANLDNRHYLRLSHNLLGCPEIQIWTVLPTKLNNNNVIITCSEFNLSVTTTVNLKQQICVNGLFGGESFHSCVIRDYSPPTLFNLPANCKNYTVTVRGKYYIPYIAPLYLQNESVSGTHYLHTSNVYIGSNVTAEKQTGNFTITSNADVTIEPIGEVTLDAGFKVEQGGSFEIKANQ